jgi:ATP-dependent Lon protease
MAFEFRLPDIGEGLTEAEVVEWLVEEGQDVALDQPLVQIETDKAVTDIPSPRAGVLLRRGAEAGSVVRVGEVLAVIGEAGEGGTMDAAPIVGTLPPPLEEKSRNESRNETSSGPGDAVPVLIEAKDVKGYLGRQKFWFEAADRTSVPGVATGLAVTGTGGDVLFIEATRMEDEGGRGSGEGLTLTGQLGDVMKESAMIALSYVHSHAQELGIAPDQLQGRFHVHVPAGAVPKDGPSAGIAMTTALASLLSNRPVKATVGMTGEVTLQGRVLPIGGVKQKVLAAHRAGLKEVILPKRNEGDLEDVPEQVRRELTFHTAETIQDVLARALEPVAGGRPEESAAA